MSIDIWFKNAWGLRLMGVGPLRPVKHPKFPIPIEISRGQASNYLLSASDKSRWFLKKFASGKRPSDAYVGALRSLIPRGGDMIAGSRRFVITDADVERGDGGKVPAALLRWVDGSVLSPKAPGDQWSQWLSDIADGSAAPDPATRRSVVASLVRAVLWLESVGVSHRDLSGGNVLVDGGAIQLIDWDTMFHPSLAYQSNTAIGSLGYMAPWLGPDARDSWRPLADRFALSLMVAEAWSIERGTALVGEGNLFDQATIGRPSAALEGVRRSLRREAPMLAAFERAWTARSFDACPGPRDWAIALGATELLAEADSLSELATAVIAGRLPDAERHLTATPWLADAAPSAIIDRYDLLLESVDAVSEALKDGDYATLGRLISRGVLDPLALTGSSVVDVDRAVLLQAIETRLRSALDSHDPSGARSAASALRRAGGSLNDDERRKVEQLIQLGPYRPEYDGPPPKPTTTSSMSTTPRPTRTAAPEAPETAAEVRRRLESAHLAEDWPEASRAWIRMRATSPGDVTAEDRSLGQVSMQHWGASLTGGEGL